jgi:hypothetical protein
VSPGNLRLASQRRPRLVWSRQTVVWLLYASLVDPDPGRDDGGTVQRPATVQQAGDPRVQPYPSLDSTEPARQQAGGGRTP